MKHLTVCFPLQVAVMLHMLRARAQEEGRALMWYLEAVRHPAFWNPPGYNLPDAAACMYMKLKLSKETTGSGRT